MSSTAWFQLSTLMAFFEKKTCLEWKKLKHQNVVPKQIGWEAQQYLPGSGDWCFIWPRENIHMRSLNKKITYFWYHMYYVGWSFRTLKRNKSKGEQEIAEHKRLLW